MQVVLALTFHAKGDNLHEMSKPVYRKKKNKKNISKCPPFTTEFQK